jgi:tetratricopeptide (TPR) repeat protein
LIHLLFAATVAAAAPAAQAGCPSVVTPDALVCRALEAQKAGNNESAAQAFEEAAKAANDKDPKTARMYAAAGNLWIAANQPGKAALDLDKALALSGLEAEQRGEALLDRARAAEAQDDLKTARAKLNEAAATISDDPFFWYFSAALALRESDGATATNAIGRALTLAPSDPAILFEAGHVADFNGNDDQARTYWMRAAGSDPNGPVGKAAAKAIEMLGLTPTMKSETQPPAQANQPKS